jgi:hypothetical protein
MLNAGDFVWLVVAAIGACCALGIWFVFLRPVPTQTASAIIVDKRFRPAGTKWIHPVGQRTNFWTPTAFPVAEGYEFTCRLDDGSAEAVAVLGVGMAERFEVGQPITIVYQHRNFGPFWQRTYVLGMQKVPA